jgi:cysteine desulfurase / selenocysteine lyase
MSGTAESAHLLSNLCVVHLNHAGASPCSDATYSRIIQHLQLERKVGGYMAEEMIRKMELPHVYQSIADLIHAADLNEIAIVESATVAWTRFFYAAAQHQLEQSPHSSPPSPRFILVSEADYAANAAAVCHWCNTHLGWHVLSIPSVATNEEDVATTGKVDLQKLNDMLNGRYWYYNEMQEEIWLDSKCIAMICIAHVPTNSGIVNPVEDIGAMIAKYNKIQFTETDQPPPQIIYFVDACQSVGQLDVDVQKIQCHGLAASGRKYLRGPRGTGFLYVSNSIVEFLRPNHADHYSTPVEQVPADFSFRRPFEGQVHFCTRLGARRFEFWESSVALKLGLGVAVAEAMQIGLSVISDRILQRSIELHDKLLAISRNCTNQVKLRLYRRPECGIVTFWIDCMDTHRIKEYLWNVREERIEDVDTSARSVRFALSVVPATSTPVDSSSSAAPDMIRASVSYTTTTQEVDLFCACILNLLQVCMNQGGQVNERTILVPNPHSFAKQNVNI